MLQIATFFAIGPQICVDGIIVIDEVQKRPVGRISSKHVIAVYAFCYVNIWPDL
ncbi:MAG: hypothetical protein WBF33_28530 [Candidatus Nitrosopolaris sp.]|jgi:hypothetical protein